MIGLGMTGRRMTGRGRLAGLALLGLLAACQPPAPPRLPPPLPAPLGNTVAAARIDGPVGGPDAGGPPQLSYGAPRSASPSASAGAAATTPGDYTLDFVDTDIRDVVAQILGTMLKANYAIDTQVQGKVTMHTAAPLAQSQLLPILQSLLAQCGATLVQSGPLYRVTASAGGDNLLAGDATLGGGLVVPLRYAGADYLAKELAPYVNGSGRIVADPGRNALIVVADPNTRATLLNLITAFDVDTLAGQSYALLPVGSGDAREFATALSDALRAQSSAALAAQIHVVPMERVNAVLVTSPQPRFIDTARRVYALLDRGRRATLRGWHVYYLQNSRSNDVAYVLQQAFTPNRVTAIPTPNAAQAGPARQMNAPQASPGSATAGSATPAATGATAGGGAGADASSAAPANGAPGAQAPDVTSSLNPLLGGLDQSGTGSGASQPANTMRIIPNDQNNAILVYGTANENDTVAAMLRKIDVMPVQVRIDATIAEVTLNDQLQYGTQFYFKSGGINALLTTAATGALATSFPGFLLSGHGNDAAPIAISALQAITTVHVLSSPELLVLDNQPARLQVGNAVPYLTSSSQSTVTSSSPVINSINYRETGVIMQVTPRVSSSGLVAMDISQEVSSIDTTATPTTGINSPTFQERNIRSRVVVQDGQTIGLAGLIQDNISRGNSGLPWLKDIPVLGLLAGTQTNSRTRTELLVLITPHVIHDQRDAYALTQDLRDQLGNAALVPMESQMLPLQGRSDPSLPLRRQLQLER